MRRGALRWRASLGGQNGPKAQASEAREQNALTRYNFSQRRRAGRNPAGFRTMIGDGENASRVGTGADFKFRI